MQGDDDDNRTRKLISPVSPTREKAVSPTLTYWTNTASKQRLSDAAISATFVIGEVSHYFGSEYAMMNAALRSWPYS